MRKYTALAALLFPVLAGSLLIAAAQRHPSTPAQQEKMPVGTIGPISTIRPAPAGYHYRNGEVLHYTTDWRLWSAGTATLRLDQAGSEEKVSATADSIGFAALLYTVQDRLQAYFNPRTFCSSRIDKHSEEGLHKRDTHIVFNYARHKAVLDERNLRDNETKHTENDIPGCVSDVLSGIFYLGSLPLTVGSTYHFPINDGGKTVDVSAYVEAREDVKTGAGTFHTVRVQPSAPAGVLKNRGKVWIWYTDDSAHLPVQMRARLFWGTLTFQLSRVDRQ